MTTIFACGEGAHDIGQDDWNRRTAAKTFSEGWMQPLIRKIAGDDVTIVHRYHRQIVVLPTPRALIPDPKGFRKKAALAKYIAEQEGCDVVVFMTDADTNLEKERKEKVNEIEEGFALIENEVQGVPCVPRSTSECWLLCDQNAWKELGLTDLTNFPNGSPEDLWGVRQDSRGNHPKHVFSRVAEDADIEDGRETRRLISASSSLQCLKDRCPASFTEFASALSSAFS